MLRIRIEFLPHDDEKQAKIIGEAIIYNEGGSDDIGRYNALIKSDGNEKRAHVVHDRIGRSAWALLHMVLHKIYTETSNSPIFLRAK